MKYYFYCLLLSCFFIFKTGIVSAQCTADAGADMTLTCTITEVALAGASNVPNATFSWTGPNNFTSTVSNPTVNLPGQYDLTITDPGDGCTATASVLVLQDIVAPVFSLTATPTCDIDGSITADGSPAFQYLWNTHDTTSTINNIPSGTYCVTVTAPNGCTTADCAVVEQFPQALVGSSITQPLADNKNGSIILTPVSMGTPLIYQWSGPNGFTATTPGISGLGEGTYVVTVINPVSGCITVYTYILIRIYLPLTIYNIVNCDGLVHFQISPAEPPYTISWGNESQVVTQPAGAIFLAPGTYTITVTDGNNTSETATVVVPPVSPPCTFIEGDIRYDANNDCLIGATESGFGGQTIRAEGGGAHYYAQSDADGHYRLRIQPGNYSITLYPGSSQYNACDNNVPVFIAADGDTATVDFSIQGPDVNCPSLEVNLSTSLLRRCFDNNFYYLHYRNASLAHATDAYIDLTLDPLLEMVSASQPYSDMGNGIFRFQLGTVQSFNPGFIWVRVAVSCDAVLGQTHCTEAHIFPDTLCEPANPLWSGALLQVSSRCDGDSLRFILKNTGTAPMSELLEYIVIEDGTMGLQGGSPPLAAGDSMIVSVPATGATWHIEAKQEPFAPPAPLPERSVEGCVTSGTFNLGYINQFTLGDDVPWIDENCTPNTGAYDPNDKQGFPTGFGAKHYIRPGTELEYLIRFQNTGTDTAFSVVIRDTLSEWLDPLTVRSGASSHPYRFELTGAGTLIFDFQNILLPDSNVNEAASHGFVQFRIRPRADVPLETDIFNNAAIYFDFNDPIITNTTTHRIGENFISVGLWQPEKPAYTVSISPHPLTDASWISVAGLTTPSRLTGNTPGNFHLSIFDLTGRQVRALSAAEPRFLLRKDDLPEGTYLFKVDVDGVPLGTGKLVVF